MVQFYALYFIRKVCGLQKYVFRTHTHFKREVPKKNFTGAT